MSVVQEVAQNLNNPAALMKREYQLTVDHAESVSEHPIACRHFALEDFDALARMAKEEVDNGYMVTINIVTSSALTADYDDRVSGAGSANISHDGNEKAH